MERLKTYATIIILLLCAGIVIMTGCSSQPNRSRVRDSVNSKKTVVSSVPEQITGLIDPVAMAFAPDGRIFITERTTGAIRVFNKGKLQQQPYATFPVAVLFGYSEAGLLGIAIAPSFPKRPHIFVYYTYQKNGVLHNRVVRITDSKGKATKVMTILDGIPGGNVHNGGILKFGPDGALYISTGETGNKPLAQSLKSYGGKILRINIDGSVPKNNPFRKSPIYSYGHRNVFGMAFQPKTGTLYITENGPESNDEINRIEPGRNYGWSITLGVNNNKRFVNPLTTYTPTIAPTQAIFYTGNRFTQYKGWFIFGAYNTRVLHALTFTGRSGTKVSADKIVYKSNEPIVGMAQSPDGNIYIIGTQTIQKIKSLIK